MRLDDVPAVQLLHVTANCAPRTRKLLGSSPGRPSVPRLFFTTALDKPGWEPRRQRTVDTHCLPTWLLYALPTLLTKPRHLPRLLSIPRLLSHTSPPRPLSLHSHSVHQERKRMQSTRHQAARECAEERRASKGGFLMTSRPCRRYRCASMITFVQRSKDGLRRP